MIAQYDLRLPLKTNSIQLQQNVLTSNSEKRLDEVVKILDEENMKLNEENERLKTRIQKCVKEYEIFQADYVRKLEELNNVKKQLFELESRSEKANFELVNLKEVLFNQQREFENILADIKSQLNEKNKQIENLQKHVEILKTPMEESQNKLEIQAEISRSLQGELTATNLVLNATCLDLKIDRIVHSYFIQLETELKRLLVQKAAFHGLIGIVALGLSIPTGGLSLALPQIGGINVVNFGVDFAVYYWKKPGIEMKLREVVKEVKSQEDLDKALEIVKKDTMVGRYVDDDFKIHLNLSEI